VGMPNVHITSLVWEVPTPSYFEVVYHYDIL
jgi:hypothetical protein